MGVLPDPTLLIGRIARFSSRALTIFGLLAAACCGWATAAAAPDAREAMRAAAARQRASVAAMRQSVERQRAAVGLAPRPAPPAQADPAGEQAAAECPVLAPAAVESVVHRAARRQGVEPDLLRAVIRQESAFRPCAVSPKGALGLMQLMPATAADLGVRNPFDPEENVQSGARFLRQLLLHYGGNLAQALAAYNAGPAAVDQNGGSPPYDETRQYVRGILTQLGLDALER